MVELQTLCTTGAWTLYFAPDRDECAFIRAAAAPDKLMILETTLVTIDYVEQLTTHDMSSHTTGQQMPAEGAAEGAWLKMVCKRRGHGDHSSRSVILVLECWSFWWRRLLASAKKVQACMHAWGEELGLGFRERCNPLFARHILFPMCSLRGSQCVPEEVPNGTSSNNGSFKPSVHPLAN
jgi:hypothetical protein